MMWFIQAQYCRENWAWMILIRFHRARTALSADISEMFLQVEISESDHPYHKFLWQHFKSARDPCVYEFNWLLFGNTASPFCAQFVLQTHAQEHSAKYPNAMETVENAMYVDNVLIGFMQNCQGSTGVVTPTFRSCWKCRLQTENGSRAKFLSSKMSCQQTDFQVYLEITDGLLPTQKTLGIL